MENGDNDESKKICISNVFRLLSINSTKIINRKRGIDILNICFKYRKISVRKVKSYLSEETEKIR